MKLRRKVRPCVSAACVMLLGLTSAPVPAADCAALLQQHLQSDTSLPFVEFDQDDAKGWRALSNQGCDPEATTLIQAYIAKQEKPHPLLIWHLAQSLAKAQRYPEAIAAARKTLRPAESEERAEFLWNEYVNGTIAFLEGDSESLKRHRDRLELAAATHSMNHPNFIALSRLQKCIGKTYKEAYSCEVGP